jgi:hypothetical protein
MNRITPALPYIKPLGQLASASLIQASIAALVSRALGASPLCGALVAAEYVLARRGISLISTTIENSPFLYEHEAHWRVVAGFALALAARATCGLKKFEPTALSIIVLPLFEHTGVSKELRSLIGSCVPAAIRMPLGGSIELARCASAPPIANIVLSQVGMTLAVRMAKALGGRSFHVEPPAPVLAALFISLIGTTLLAQALKTSHKELGPWLRHV